MYDYAARKFLQDTVAERAKFNAKNIDPQHWAFVKRRKEVNIFSSVPGSTNQSIIVMVGDGRLEDVMGRLYCDTTHELRTAKVLLGYNLKDGSVLNAHERRTPEDPFRFAGIKWFAGKCVRPSGSQFGVVRGQVGRSLASSTAKWGVVRGQVGLSLAPLHGCSIVCQSARGATSTSVSMWYNVPVMGTL